MSTKVFYLLFIQYLSSFLLNIYDRVCAELIMQNFIINVFLIFLPL